MITNITKNIIIAKEYSICKSLLSKARGLMFSKKRTLVFEFEKEKLNSLHMFFVFFPIDVFFLDKNCKVVEIKKDFRPFSFFRSKEKSKFIVETYAGKARETKTNIGDNLRID
ncbi:MAG: DUF192 domain-containing protein [Nanobdellota archaeon]